MEKINLLLTQLKKEKPLILNITNHVTMDFIANGLLSLGASPVMSLAKDELIDLIQMSNAIVINLGTLHDEFISLCEAACHIANQLGKPIILDPVGAGATHYRTGACLRLLANYRIAIIRGNASEIKALAGITANTKGVDSRSASEEAVTAGNDLSKRYNAVVVISGKIDFIIEQDKIAQCHAGSALMPSITGTGCLLSAVVAAFHAIEADRFKAAQLATEFYGMCGEKAEQETHAPGSFKIKFLDALASRLHSSSSMVDDSSRMFAALPCVLTIAGTDPSGGAGIQADIKAISATQSYAASVITALVAQNTQGVQSIHQIPAEFVTQQLESVFSDLTIHAVKIGMLHDEKIIAAVATMLEKVQPPHVVLDPVMVAKNGCPLLRDDVLAYLQRRLFPLVHLITPNLYEAEKIVGEKISTPAAMEAAAKLIGMEYGINVLIKGGHLETEQAMDVLYLHQSGLQHWFYAQRIQSKNTHGTGCTLSSAIASFLAQGYSVYEAIQRAKEYLTQAIYFGQSLPIGHGHGPVNHFYFLRGKKYDVAAIASTVD